MGGASPFFAQLLLLELIESIVLLITTFMNHIVKENIIE